MGDLGDGVFRILLGVVFGRVGNGNHWKMKWVFLNFPEVEVGCKEKYGSA